jgi:cytochrome c oxidase subunit 2
MPKSSSDPKHFILAGVLVAIATGLMYWILSAALPLPPQASAQAIVIDQLIDYHVMVIAFLFALVVVFMLYTIVVFRRRANDDSDGDHFEGNTTLEIVWTVVPLLLVVVFAFIGWNALADVTRSQPDELEVKAIGFQWSWQFEYGEGVFSPELVVPVNRPVLVKLESRDVLHSFWVPEFRVKQDLVPGQTQELRFTPTLVGEYKVRCAELCGRNHYSMESPVRVVDQAEYEAWLADLTGQ